jgi:hypothetical protein
MELSLIQSLVQHPKNGAIIHHSGVLLHRFLKDVIYFRGMN